MASEELVQNFRLVRSYIRSFFIYGYKSRTDFIKCVKDRTYGEYLHKIDNWLGTFSVDTKKDNKESIHYIQVDSHKISSNPFYESLKTRIFKDAQITLHFFLIDILKKYPQGLTKNEILCKLEFKFGYIENLDPDEPYITDDQLRYFLEEYEKLGLIKSSPKKPKQYTLSNDIELTDDMLTAVQFFSEADDLGFFGSTLLDLQDVTSESPFVFKHHYLSHVLNTEIVYQLLQAIKENKLLQLNLNDSKNLIEIGSSDIVVPLKIYRSTETGRAYLLSYYCEKQHYNFCFLDDIDSMEEITKNITFPGKAHIQYIKKHACCSNYQQLLEDRKNFTDHVWGISTIAYKNTPTKVEVIFHVEKDEYYILNRLQREKRQGQLTQVGSTSYKFSITLSDPREIIPWLRSYIMRLESIYFEDKEVEKLFMRDFQEMMKLYDVKEEKQKCLKPIA